MTLAYAITAYKCQGDTLDEVIIDFSHEAGERANIQWGSFYVALTRVKEGKNVYLKTFEESFITFNIKVENKIAAMREQKQYRFKKIYLSEKIFNDDEEIKLGYFNIRGFLESDHAKYLDHDLNLLRVNFLVISETWLNHETANHEVISKLKNWKIIKRLDATDNRKHMGILFLAPNSYTEYPDALFNLDYVEGYSKRKNDTLLYQGIIIELNIIYKRIVCLYIRETPNKEETYEIANRFRDFDCIMGDLNLNPAIPDQKSKLLALCGKDKMLALEEITTVFNNQLEHIILEKTLSDNCFATSFFNLASDHKPVVVRIGERMSNFTKEFKEKRNFDVDSNYYYEYKHRPNNAQEQSIRKKKTSLTEESNNNKDGTKKTKRVRKETTAKTQPERKTNMFTVCFENPPGRNLCFSNSAVSCVLNIPIITTLMKEYKKEHEDKDSLLDELSNLAKLRNFSESSTSRLRYLVQSKCFEAGQWTKNFDDNRQHDSGEFIHSMLEHLFQEDKLPIGFRDQAFGGLCQNTLK